MSFVRRVSRACQRCRVRRIKCDLQKPNCSQCVKRSLRCPGYDHDNSPSSTTTSKPPPRRPPTAIQKASPSKDAESSLVAPPKIPIEELTSCHFVANFILVPQLQGMRGFFEFVAPLLSVKHDFPHFRYAFEACSIASLNNRLGPKKELETTALGSYTRALTATRKALKESSMMKHDATLAAVLLLGLYETITANSWRALPWASHIDGAVQLVKSRNREQVRSKEGLDLFVAARTQMVIHSLSTGKPPDMSLKWPIAEDREEKEPVFLCQQLGIRAANLKARAQRLIPLPRTSENVALLRAIVQECRDLDQEFSDWSTSLPSNFNWETAAWEHPLRRGSFVNAEVYPGRIDIYQDVWSASVWNLVRCSRIIATSVMIRCVARIQSPDDYRTTPEYAAATKIWAETISDVISSVPYFLGWFSGRRELLKGARLSRFACGVDDAEKGLSGYLLTFPLRCIQAQDYVTDSQREWIKGRLKHIGASLGVRAAMMPQVNRPAEPYGTSSRPSNQTRERRSPPVTLTSKADEAVRPSTELAR